ncbi:tyrosine-type recombinase/integrase, partial [Propionibacterium freudenreichii]|uniref:tyrosine-type recombinase/integrase n=1 Tax=Propionibacterium freudenreichii TaxID=1744 RepID=UPI0038519386
MVVGRLGPNPHNTQKYNQKLQEIAHACGINREITSHTGRHTFAVTWLENGGDIFKLSEIMVHTSIKTTMIYAKITDKGRDAEVDKVFG